MRNIKLELLGAFIEGKTDHIEKMLKRVMPETGIEEGEMLEYVEGKLEDVDCKDMQPREMYSWEDWSKVSEFCTKDPTMAILYALFIGFSNGVKWHKDKNGNIL